MNILTNSFVIHFYSRIWNEAFLGIENYESDHIYVNHQAIMHIPYALKLQDLCILNLKLPDKD